MQIDIPRLRGLASRKYKIMVLQLRMLLAFVVHIVTALNQNRDINKSLKEMIANDVRPYNIVKN